MADVNMDLLMSMLLGGANSLMQGNQFMQGVVPIAQQQISAESASKAQQSYIKQLEMLSRFLGKGPEFKSDRDGKLTISGDISSLFGDGSSTVRDTRSTFGDIGSVLGGAGLGSTETPLTFKDINLPERTRPNMQEVNAPGSNMQDILNPSASPLGALSPSDLVGLTPQDVFNAMASARGVEGLRQQAIASHAAANKVEALDRPFFVPVNGRPVTFREWNALDKDTQAYSTYKHFAEQRGDEEIMSEKEFKQEVDPNTQYEFLKLIEEDPAAFKTAKELREASRPIISADILSDRRRAFAGVDVEGYLTEPGPKGLSAQARKFVSENRRKVSAITDKALAEGKTISREKAKMMVMADFIESEIRRSGKILNVRMEGRTRIWTVEMKSGEIIEVKHDF